MAIGVGSGVVVLVVAIILVVTLVVTPNHRAAQAAATASAQAAQEYQDAADAFNSASQACTAANSSLSAAITSAQQAAKTDPSTMQDPTLIDKVNQAVTTAQGVKNCTPPTMANGTDAITQQTTQLAADTQTVTSATSTLSSASSAVTASVSAKQQAAAQAAAEAAAAAGRGSATWTDPDGYVYEISWSDMKLTVTIDPTQGKPGQLVLEWQSQGTVTVTNQTPGKQAPDIYLIFAPVYSTSVGTLGRCSTGDITLAGQDVWTYSPICPAISLQAGKSGVSQTIGVGASETESATSVASTDSPLIASTNDSPNDLIAQFENPSGWAVSASNMPWDFTDGSYCFGGQGYTCWVGVSDSLAG